MAEPSTAIQAASTAQLLMCHALNPTVDVKLEQSMQPVKIYRPYRFKRFAAFCSVVLFLPQTFVRESDNVRADKALLECRRSAASEETPEDSGSRRSSNGQQPIPRVASTEPVVGHAAGAPSSNATPSAAPANSDALRFAGAGPAEPDRDESIVTSSAPSRRMMGDTIAGGGEPGRNDAGGGTDATSSTARLLYKEGGAKGEVAIGPVSPLDDGDSAVPPVTTTETRRKDGTHEVRCRSTTDCAVGSTAAAAGEILSDTAGDLTEPERSAAVVVTVGEFATATAAQGIDKAIAASAASAAVAAAADRSDHLAETSVNLESLTEAATSNPPVVLPAGYCETSNEPECASPSVADHIGAKATRSKAEDDGNPCPSPRSTTATALQTPPLPSTGKAHEKQVATTLGEAKSAADSPRLETRSSIATGESSRGTGSGAPRDGESPAPSTLTVECLAIRKPNCLAPKNVVARVHHMGVRGNQASTCEGRERLAARIQLSVGGTTSVAPGKLGLPLSSVDGGMSAYGLSTVGDSLASGGPGLSSASPASDYVRLADEVLPCPSRSRCGSPERWRPGGASENSTPSRFHLLSSESKTAPLCGAGGSTSLYEGVAASNINTDTDPEACWGAGGVGGGGGGGEAKAERVGEGREEGCLGAGFLRQDEEQPITVILVI